MPREDTNGMDVQVIVHEVSNSASRATLDTQDKKVFETKDMESWTHEFIIFIYIIQLSSWCTLNMDMEDTAKTNE